MTVVFVCLLPVFYKHHHEVCTLFYRKMTRDWASLLTTITTLTEFIFIPRTAGEHSLCGDEE